MSRRVVVSALAAVLSLSSAAHAQVPWGVSPQEPQQPVPTRPTVPTLPDRENPFAAQPEPRLQHPLDPVWTSMPRQPTFEGFPVFPSRLSGYGSYPTTGGAGDRSAIPVPLLPIAPPEDPGWPSWARLQSRRPLPFASDLALLVQNSDRVWWRQRPDDPFVPLYFHDKLSTLAPGAEVEVRQSGEFELLLHTSSRFVASGPTAVRVTALDDDAVELQIPVFTRLRVQARAREHRLRLPDGSTLRIPAAPLEGELEGPVLLLLERADEPGRFGGRATIFNAGARAVVWQYAFGEVTLQPGRRVTFFLLPPRTPVADALRVDGAAAAIEDGRQVLVRGGEATEVAWCGARFRVPPGTELRLDALQGAPFAPPPAAK